MKEFKNILIIGAGEAGVLLAMDISTNYPSFKIIGFIDDSKKDMSIYPILGEINDLCKITDLYNIDEIVIAIPSASGSLVRKILIIIKENNIPIKIVPRSQSIIRRDAVKYSDISDLDFEDFLGRRVHKKNVTFLSEFYKDKAVLITGGAGSIGSEIVRQLLDLDVKSVTVYDNSEYLVFKLDQHLKESLINKDKYRLIIGNILNISKLSHIIEETKPDIIFHAAAYKHVYLMEENPDEAVLNNVIGTKNVIDIAIKNKIPNFLFISTDKVVNPTNIMGATKKIMEYYIEEIDHVDTIFNIVRFGNVINSNGSVLPTFQRQIKELGYVTVTHPDVQRFFMSIKEASRLVINSICKSSDGEIFVLDMGELININEIAICTIRSIGLIAGKEVKINYIGLKKGEKLIEELYTDTEKENLILMEMDSVFKLRNNDKCEQNIISIITELDNILKFKINMEDLKTWLKSVFPTLKLD